LELFCCLGPNTLITEVRNFSNKILKDLMIEKFLKKIIGTSINKINPIDLIQENISKIRKDIKEFMSELEWWTRILENLGKLISTHFDRNNFVSYDEIMETVINFFNL
jgi:hypothetical protein